MNVYKCDGCGKVYERGRPGSFYLNRADSNQHWDLCSATCLQHLALALNRPLRFRFNSPEDSEAEERL